MLAEEIKKVLKGEVAVSEADLEKYSRDASIFEVRPAVVVHPKNAEDLKRLVDFVNTNRTHYPGLSITARSAGTDMSGGPLGESIVVDFTTHFDKIMQISTGAGRINTENAGEAWAEPGVYYRDFEKKSLAKGLILPCYTASKNINTLGGMVGNNSAGEKSLLYGQTLRYTEEVSAILADGNEYTFGPLDERELEGKLKLSSFEGEIYRKVYHLLKENQELLEKARPSTSKNSTGYLLWEVCPGLWGKARAKGGKYFNLAKLFVGSQGTLGLITRIKFSLVRPKAHSELLVIFLKDLKSLGDIVRTVAGFGPEALETFDDHTLKLALKFLPDMVRKMKGGLARLLWQFLPELWMAATGGAPKLILLAEFSGESKEEAQRRMAEALSAVTEKFRVKTRVAASPEESEKFWTIRRESFNLLRQHSQGRSTAPFIDDIVVHPQDLPEFLPKLNKIFEKYPTLIYTIAGHAGDANFHIIPLMDLRRKEDHDIIPKLSDEVFSLVLSYGGSLAAEHNDGIVRTPYLEKMYGREVVELFEQTKDIFDPLNIFNPGKKVRGSLDYAVRHIKNS